MPTLNLKNITIEQRQTIGGETFFLIKDNDTSQNYFCFQNKLKDNWHELVSNYQNVKEAEIEYLESEKGNKVTSLFTQKESEFII